MASLEEPKQVQVRVAKGTLASFIGAMTICVGVTAGTLTMGNAAVGDEKKCAETSTSVAQSTESTLGVRKEASNEVVEPNASAASGSVDASKVATQNKGKNTIETIVALYGDAAHKRLKERFDQANVSYPPKAIKLLGLKTEKLLEIYSVDGDHVQYVSTYPILGTSGEVGPKLREGDKQMPEGFYKIREFEPNSSYHVALRVDYPSPFDLEMGKQDARTSLGSDIMIHGIDRSVGCLAMGDPAAEDLFILVNDVGLDNTELIMSPFDFRKPPQGVSLPDKPSWVSGMYDDLKKQISKLPNHS
jgi:hypothetical protein